MPHLTTASLAASILDALINSARPIESICAELSAMIAYC